MDANTPEMQQESLSAQRLFEALGYAKLGWAVLPLYSSLKNGRCSCKAADCKSSAKHPRISNGLKGASKDPLQVCSWWQEWPEANIGIATGAASGIIVVDIDPRHGGDQSWDAWAASHDVPQTLTALTGGGGRHLFFRAPAHSIKNRAGLLPGVDIRGDGGYIVAPNSIHASGQAYIWESSFSLDHIAPLPTQLQELLSGSSNVIPLKGNRIPNGSRNNTLTSLAGLLRRQGLEEEGIREALFAFNQTLCHPPLDAKEVNTIVQSILKYERPELVADNEWVSPKPLPVCYEKAPNLSESMLPNALKPWMLDIAERMQIPLDFIAAPVIVTLSSVIGRQVGIYPKQKDDWLVVPNLWGSVVARPGFFKSPAIAEAIKPLELLAEKARRQFESQQIVAKTKRELLQAKIDGLKETIKKVTRKGNHYELESLGEELEQAIGEQDSITVVEKRYKTNDATVEKLGCLLKENENGILVLRDELYGWLKGMQKHGREGDREFYLESWNGYGSYTVDRIGRGTLHVPALCLSIFGGLQPGKLENYVSQTLSGGKGDDGFLQRFQILVYPELSKKWKNIDRKPNLKALEDARDVFLALSEIDLKNLGVQDSSEKAVSGLRFEAKAQELFDDWRGALEKRLRSEGIGSPAYESHLAKYRSLVPSLALIFHLTDVALTKRSSPLVSVDALNMAIEWSKFLEAHAKKVYMSAMHPEIKAAHALVSKIKSGAVKDCASLRSIYRHHWALLDSIDKLEAAISVLEEVSWVKVETIKIASTTTDRLRINPNLQTSGLL